MNITDLIAFSINIEEIFSLANLFMIAVALFWMIIASIQDFKRREVENWWNFSLIAFVLAFRAFLSIENWNYWYFIWGIIGLVAGFILMNAFYYGRMFAGGDAKLLMALGTILPLSLSWKVNLGIFIAFIFLFLIAGAVYGLIYSFVLMAMNYKKFEKEFLWQFREYGKIIYLLEIISLVFIISFWLAKFYLGVALSFILLISPLLLIYAKTIEESCMMIKVDVKNLTIGDWIVNPVKAGKKIIKPNWEGLSERELKLIQKKLKGRVLVKQGIPFVPAFLLAFIIMLYILHYNLI